MEKEKIEDKIEITTLPPDRWQEYKAIRLEAIKNDPQAFGRSLEQTLAEPDVHWENRLHEAERGDAYLFFAHSEKTIVGMIGAYFPKDQQDTARLVGVFVKPNFRNKGIANALISHLLGVLKKDPRAVRIKLEVNIDQTAALALYEKYGFQIVRTTKNTLGDGKEHDEYVMEVTL